MVVTILAIINFAVHSINTNVIGNLHQHKENDSSVSPFEKSCIGYVQGSMDITVVVRSIVCRRLMLHHHQYVSAECL